MIRLVGGVVDQNFPVVAAAVGGVAADEVVEGVAAAQDVAVVVHNHIFIVHPALGFPGLGQVDGVVEADFHIRVAGQGVKDFAALHAHQAGKAVHQDFDLHALLGFAQHDGE